MLDNNNTHNNTYTIIKENKIKINNFNIKEIKIKGVCWRNIIIQWKIGNFTQAITWSI